MSRTSRRIAPGILFAFFILCSLPLAAEEPVSGGRPCQVEASL